MAASLLWLWCRLCSGRRGPALVSGGSRSGSVRGLGYRYGHGALAVPWGTLVVATPFSPCPLVQEWKHRIRRSPHDTGQVGTSPDAPFSLAVAFEADPARTTVHRPKSRPVLCILS